MMLAVPISLMILIGVTTANESPEQLRLRSYGPYGRGDSDSGFSTNNYPDHSFRPQNSNSRNSNSRKNTNSDKFQNNGYNLESYYNNHNFDSQTDNNNNRFTNDNHQKENNAGYRNGMTSNQPGNKLDPNTFNGFGFDFDYGQSADTTNGNLFNEGSNSNQLNDLISLYQNNPDEFRRRVSEGQFSDIDWNDQDIRRDSDMASMMASYGGISGNRASLDVYSVLAIGMFTAFLSYVIYFFITSAADGEGARESQILTNIIDTVTNAIQRWTLLEYLPDHLSETDFFQFLKRS